MDNEYSISDFTPQNARQWDAFVRASRNATFLLQRAYMDYHADRFADYSLMIYSGYGAKRRLIALFAACKGEGRSISAHGGLTYGGLVLPFRGVDGTAVVEVMTEILTYYRNAGYNKLRYKSIPHIYHLYPCEEDIYALFRCGARLAECNLSSVIDLGSPVDFNENSRRNMRKAEIAGVKVGKSDDYQGFWALLETLLCERYSTLPVHTLAEISLLASRFPENIELFVARNAEGTIIAGTVIYRTATCMHAQYIAASPDGKSNGALYLLFRHLISEESEGVRYFDFGTSNEDHGRYLNAGLLRQKNGMGGRGIAYNIYEVDL